MTIKPFQFNLKKYTSEHRDFLDRLNRFESACVQKKISQIMKDVFKSVLRKDLNISLSTIDMLGVGNALNNISKSSILLSVQNSNSDLPIILEVDSFLAYHIIKTILGEPSEQIPNTVEFNDTELAVMEYFMMRVLYIMHEQSSHKDIHLRLNGIISYDQLAGMMLTPRFSGEKLAHILTQFQMPSLNGFVRIFIPQLISQSEWLQIDDSFSSIAEHRHVQSMKDAGYIRMPVRAECGLTRVTESEIQSLEKDDIIIFDESDVYIDKQVLKGDVVLRIGHGTQGGYSAHIDSTKKQLKCKITGFVQGDPHEKDR